MTRHAGVRYSDLHHALLRAVGRSAVTLHPAGWYAVHGIPLSDDAEQGLRELIFAEHAEIARNPDSSGASAIPLTRYGNGVLHRWDTEHPDASELLDDVAEWLVASPVGPWDERGGAMWMGAETWGLVLDALIEHRDTAQAGRDDMRVVACVRLITAINQMVSGGAR